MNRKILTPQIIENIMADYKKAVNRLILLDYDGTLTAFTAELLDAKPDEELLDILKKITADPKNTVVLISGRDKETLNLWFADIPFSFTAEHGVYNKNKGQKTWEITEPLSDDWKKEIFSIFNSFVKQTPGSFIEEKSFSLAWHYRKSESTIAQKKALELKKILINKTQNTDLMILDGHKALEIKNSKINKGHSALKWLAKFNPDFILCLGDDVTDEDMFKVLPKTAYSIKIGQGQTQARYAMLQDINAVRQFLKKLLLNKM